MNRIPLAGFYPGPGSPNWLLTDMFFVTEALAELQRRAGGPVLQNLDHHYRLDPVEIAYLGSLGVDAEGLDYSGKIKHPVLTMHTTVDGFVPTAGEGVYNELIAEAGRSDRLVQVYTASVSHCGFTGTQLVTAVQAVDAWIATGTPPPPAAFPAARVRPRLRAAAVPAALGLAPLRVPGSSVSRSALRRPSSPSRTGA